MEKFQDEEDQVTLNASALFHTADGALFHTVRNARESLTVRFSTPSRAFSSFPTVRFSTPYIEYAIPIWFFEVLLYLKKAVKQFGRKFMSDNKTERYDLDGHKGTGYKRITMGVMNRPREMAWRRAVPFPYAADRLPAGSFAVFRLQNFFIVIWTGCLTSTTCLPCTSPK